MNFKFWAPKNKTSGLKNQSGWLYEMFGNKSAADVDVTRQTAMQLSAVYSCVDRLSSGVASLPCKLYQYDDESNKALAKEHPLFRVLSIQVNDWCSAYEYWKWVMVCAPFQGNSYSYINRIEGIVRSLHPINPEHVTPVLYEDALMPKLAYCYQPPNKEPVTFLPGEIFHIRGMSCSSPYVGESIISAQRDTLGVAIASNEQAGKTFANGSQLSGVLKVDGSLGEETRDSIRDEWQKVYGGSSNAKKIAVLGANASFEPISMNSVDSQLLESRKYSRTEIAGIFNVPGHMIGDNEHSTFSNVEHLDLSFIKHSLRPWLTNIEQAIYRDLLTEREKQIYFAEFMTSALERGDFESRMSGYNTQINMGVLNPNEVRAKENMNPREGGDVYLTPMNMLHDGKDSREETNRLVKSTIARAVDRNIGLLNKSLKLMTKKGDYSGLPSVLKKAQNNFITVCTEVLNLTHSGINSEALAQEHSKKLKSAISKIKTDELADKTTELLSNCREQEIIRLENLLCQSV